LGDGTKTLLFVCTGNAGRSQIADLLFARMAPPGVEASSAGVAPWPHLHPAAVRLLDGMGIATAGRVPRDVREAAAGRPDFVVTIGDRARDEVPRFPGNPTLIHWDIPDPADADGTGREDEAFRDALAAIESRLPDLCTIIAAQGTAAQLHLAPGISTCIVRPDRFDAARHMPLFAAAGFACIELNCFIGSDDFPWDRAGKVKELRDIADSTGVQVSSVHAEGGLGVCRGTRSERLAVDIYRAFADLAAEVGAGLVVLHADLPRDMDRGEARRRLEETISALADHVRGMPCAFGWENMPHSQRDDSLSAVELLDWIRELGQNAFGFVLDTGHSNIAGDTDDLLGASHGIIRGLHVNDNNGQWDQHRGPGKADIRWDGFVGRLLKNGYEGPLMLEIVGVGDTPRPLEDALAEARESVEFVKSR
jgi:sugar phosphate isomerase/epimerase/protein-tyrosine-phosphatase